MGDPSMTPGECLSLGGHAYEHGRCVGCGREYPPGPPPIPRCRECRRIVGYKGHAPECSIGAEARDHWSNVQAVEKALADAIAERRTDRPFMRRLRKRVEQDGDLLARLAGDVPVPATTEEASTDG